MCQECIGFCVGMARALRNQLARTSFGIKRVSKSHLIIFIITVGARASRRVAIIITLRRSSRACPSPGQLTRRVAAGARGFSAKPSVKSEETEAEARDLYFSQCFLELCRTRLPPGILSRRIRALGASIGVCLDCVCEKDQENILNVQKFVW